MKIKTSKKTFLLFALMSVLFFSCKKDDDIQDSPNPIDENHVTLADDYGIVATFPKGEWTNSFIDTFPSTTNKYYDIIKANAIFTAQLKDESINSTTGRKQYSPGMYFFHFFKEAPDEETFNEFVDTYIYRVYTSTGNYESTSEITNVTIGDRAYEAKYLVAQRVTSSKVNGGKEHIYFIHYNQKIYGVLILIHEEEEDRLPEFEEILKTLKLS